MTEEETRAKLTAAIKVLEDIGRSFYLSEYQAGTDRWECLGLGLAHVESDCGGMLRAAHAFLEDHNYHPECQQLAAALPWAFTDPAQAS